MKTHSILLLLALSTLNLQFSTRAQAQGSLTPPPGPPAPVMKTLDQLDAKLDQRIPISLATTPGDNDNSPSLYKITQPGSYYLTNSVTGVSGKYGIEVAAANVTLDLNGFEVAGVPGSSGGVYAPGAPGLKLHNGSIRSWLNFGVLATDTDGRFEDLRLHDNGTDGLHVGDGALVAQCQARGNGSSGFRAAGRASFIDCSASFNTVGFYGGGGGLVIRCQAFNNSSSGFFFFGTASECVASQNGQDGFNNIGLMETCQASSNTRDGINGGSQVRACSVMGNSRHGVSVGAAAVVTGNTIANNGIGSGVTDGAGIVAIGDDNFITGNRCSTNDRGITVQGSHNQIEGNQLVHNGDHGLLVTGQYNLIIRNTARNTSGVNWNIAQFNRAGAYVAPVNNAAISGSTGGNGSGTTDPFANLSF